MARIKIGSVTQDLTATPNYLYLCHIHPQSYLIILQSATESTRLLM